MSVLLVAGAPLAASATALAGPAEGTTPNGVPSDLAKRRQTAELERREPSASQVRTLALRASGLRAGRDREWSARARLSAMLPQLTVRASRDIARDKGRSRVSTGTERLDIDVDRDTAVEIRAVWNLDRLVFDSVELSAARAALAEDRERANLAAQVTALYYERRRAQLALIWQPPSTHLARVERQLVIEERTAALDALTDGAFSRLLEAHSQRRP